MKWINKSNGKYRKRGRHIVERFLDRAWDNAQGCYVGCNFDRFKAERGFKTLLLEEQSHHCCYCMRLIKDNYHTTLEHVMPHNANNTDTVDYYLNFNRNMRDNVRYYHVADNSSYRISYPPYPHFCAYENLVASCDGTIPDSAEATLPIRLHLCCNNPRGNARIIPMFFVRKIEKDIVYEKDGEMTYAKKYENSIQKINLEHKTLKLIRRAWATIAEERRFSVDDVRNACKDTGLRDKIFEMSSISMKDRSTLKTDAYWNTFSDYCWFYKYFKKKLSHSVNGK